MSVHPSFQKPDNYPSPQEYFEIVADIPLNWDPLNQWQKTINIGFINALSNSSVSFEKDHEVHRHPLFLEIYLLYLVINRRKKSKYSLIQSFLFACHQQKSRDVQKYPGL